MIAFRSTPNAVQTLRMENLGFFLLETHRAGTSVWGFLTVQRKRIEIEFDDAAEPCVGQIIGRVLDIAFESGQHDKAAEVRQCLRMGKR